MSLYQAAIAARDRALMRVVTLMRILVVFIHWFGLPQAHATILSTRFPVAGIYAVAS
jgi:hypothetical protein